jgi:hypothetical protein
MTDVRIDKEFAALIPPLTDEELAGLEENILRDGIRDALVVWQGEGLLLDGHNRFAIAQKHSVTYRVKHLEFKTRDEAKAWTISNQLGRRNLTPDQASYLRGKEYELTKKAQGGTGANQHTEQSGNSCQSATAQKLADKHGVSEKTIRNDAEYARAVDELEEVAPGLRAKVMRGEGPAKKVIVEAAKLEDKEEAKRLVDTTPHVAHNSGNNEWYTPEDIVEAARSVLGRIDLDPASSATANSVVKAKKFYTTDDDGLSMAWEGRVWMNPPYASDLVYRFCEKITACVKNGAIPEAVALVNNATETKWFQLMCSVASAICFPASRIKFWHPEKTQAAPLQGQAILYFGKNSRKFYASFIHMGTIVDVRS